MIEKGFDIYRVYEIYPREKVEMNIWQFSWQLFLFAQIVNERRAFFRRFAVLRSILGSVPPYSKIWIQQGGYELYELLKRANGCVNVRTFFLNAYIYQQLLEASKRFASQIQVPFLK